MLGDDCAADFDDGELLGFDGGEVGEVLLDLALGADVVEELDDGGAGGEGGVCGGGCEGVCWGGEPAEGGGRGTEEEAWGGAEGAPGDAAKGGQHGDSN